VTEWHRDDDDLAELRGVVSRHCPPTVAQLLDEARQRLRPARVADRHLMAGIDEELGERAADVPGTNDPDPHIQSSSCEVSLSR
jgi:hypothetical protein